MTWRGLIQSWLTCLGNHAGRAAISASRFSSGRDGSTVDDLMHRGRALGAKVDDVLDACVAAWTAERIARDEAKRLPCDPPRDARGLRMEIWF
jgi:predicted RNase H-like nuclease